VEAVAARGGRDPAAEVAALRAQVAELTEQLRRREDPGPGPPDRGAGGEDPPGPGTVVRGPADQGAADQGPAA
jgi:voltage-gated potassium channel